MHCGKTTSRWRECDALVNVLLGNPGFLKASINVDVNLTRVTYLNIVADQAHPFMAMLFPDGSGLFQQDNAPCHTARIVREWFEEHDGVLGVALASKFSRSQSD